MPETGIPMGILILSLVLSAMLGCVTWFVIGDRFPLGGEPKWETSSHIAIYAGMILIPVYLLIFYLF
jgi:hypothetical protein